MGTIKVFKGTRSSDAPRLCDTCSYGVVARGEQDTQEIVFCDLMERIIKVRVVECNSYYDKTATPIHELEKIAWLIHIDSKRQKIGFQPALERRQTIDEEELIRSLLD